MNLKLRKILPIYEKFYNELLKDSPWLIKKINREERIEREIVYIDKYLPEIYSGENSILDIGSGPGEFLEICREYGNNGFDILAPEGQNPINYEEYCRIQHIQQKLDFIKVNFYNIFMGSAINVLCGKRFNIVNCKHAINIICTKHVDFDACCWIIDGLDEIFYKFFSYLSSLLDDRGVVLIAALRSNNDSDYSVVLTEMAKKSGLSLVYSVDNNVHKFIK